MDLKGLLVYKNGIMWAMKKKDRNCMKQTYVKPMDLEWCLEAKQTEQTKTYLLEVARAPNYYLKIFQGKEPSIYPACKDCFKVTK